MSDLTTADYFGMAASVLLPLIPFPQLWRMYITKTADDLELWYILLQIVANTCFLIFGILKGELFVIIPNAGLNFLNLIMIGMKYYYKLRYHNRHDNDNANIQPIPQAETVRYDIP